MILFVLATVVAFILGKQVSPGEASKTIFLLFLAISLGAIFFQARKVFLVLAGTDKNKASEFFVTLFVGILEAACWTLPVIAFMAGTGKFD